MNTWVSPRRRFRLFRARGTASSCLPCWCSVLQARPLALGWPERSSRRIDPDHPEFERESFAARWAVEGLLGSSSPKSVRIKEAPGRLRAHRGMNEPNDLLLSKLLACSRSAGNSSSGKGICSCSLGLVETRHSHSRHSFFCWSCFSRPRFMQTRIRMKGGRRR